MNTLRKAVATALIAGSTLAAGAVGVELLTGSASAQSTTSTTATDGSATTPAQGDHDGDGPNGAFDPAKGGHVGENGTKEELLTGDTAAKVTAAAQAAQPGATIERVETDAEGSPYEAHLVTADGRHVTVKVSADFTVTSTEDGPGGPGGRGPGGHGHGAPGSQPAQPGSASSTTTS